MRNIVNEAVDQAISENAARPEEHRHQAEPRGSYLLLLSLTALGIVYGDIGTSPLYAMRECFHGPHAIAVNPVNIFGVLSLVFWALIIIVTVKYLIFIMQADNRGEGGVLALTALATPIKHLTKSERWWLVVLGVFGASLLYGDGIITPAITVLGAVEGLNIATPLFEPYVMPIAIVIIIGLFLIQRHGTATVGKLFGPITLVWFIVLAVLGTMQVVRRPGVLWAANPFTPSSFSAPTAGPPSLSSAPSFSSSPAAKPSTPTWATSGVARSAWRGSPSCCPPCCSTISGRGRCCSPTPRRRRTPFI